MKPGEGPATDMMATARRLSKPELPKRFYQTATLATDEAGHGVLLDGRRLRTPNRRPISLPQRSLAEAMAAEWEAQKEEIDASSMPVTRIVNSAVDGVALQPDAVRRDIAAYAGNDLLCYRADSPAALAERQAELWDPVLEWARSELDAPLLPVEGVIPVDQPSQSLANVAAAIEPFEPLALTALHTATTLTGSAVLALALAMRRLDPGAVWMAANVDEDWQVAQWGEVPELARKRLERRRDFDASAFVLSETHG